MSSSDRDRGERPGVRPEPPSPAKPPGPTDSADPYATWLDRMQRARTRQAAITRNLYTWSNYKSWADRMRDSFAEPPPGTDANGAGSKPPKR